MGTAILRSHDCLQRRFLPNDALAIATSHIRSRKSSNPNFNSYAYQNRRRKRSPVAAVQANYHDRDRRRSSDRSVAPAKVPATASLVMGQVKILKRGEKLSPENSHGGLAVAVPAENRKARVKSEEDVDLFLGSTDRLGPDPVTVQKQIRVSDLKDGIYAGSAFVSSPPPSSVPVPGFLGKNGAATSDLRRLLRLDLE
ncbi:Proline-rich nuclear receptor coactivator motif [Sesbania bispinosa]|nr:Proline-rich nuclear receptor coactivator motif [Sesbania bispinosa]